LNSRFASSLGKNGVEEILSYGELSAFEQKAKEDMLDTLKKDIQEGIREFNSEVHHSLIRLPASFPRTRQQAV